jgi:hypothetical protein
MRRGHRAVESRAAAIARRCTVVNLRIRSFVGSPGNCGSATADARTVSVNGRRRWPPRGRE